MNLRIKLYCFLIVFLTILSSKAFSQEFIVVTPPSEQTRMELEQMYSMPDATGELASPSLRSGPPVGPPIGGIPTGELPIAILALTSVLYLVIKKNKFFAKNR